MKKTKTEGRKKMGLLFPLDELLYVKLSLGKKPPLLIYHRKGKCFSNCTELGPTGEFAVLGLGFFGHPRLDAPASELRCGYFRFKESAQQKGNEGDIGPHDENLIRFVMAGVELGERRARINQKTTSLGYPKIVFSDGRLGELRVAVAAWRLWPYWASQEFKSTCPKSYTLINWAHTDFNSRLRSGGSETMMVGAFTQMLKRLKLPL